MNLLIPLFLLCICVILIIIKVVQDMIKLVQIQSFSRKANIQLMIDNGQFVLSKVQGVDIKKDADNITLIKSKLQGVNFADLNTKLQMITQKLPNITALNNKMDKICNQPILKSVC